MINIVVANSTDIIIDNAPIIILDTFIKIFGNIFRVNLPISICTSE